MLACAELTIAASPWPPIFTQQAQSVLAKMSLTEKLNMVHGYSGPYVGDVPAQTLSDGTVIPAMNMHDGPQGMPITREFFYLCLY